MAGGIDDTKTMRTYVDNVTVVKIVQGERRNLHPEFMIQNEFML